MAQKGAFGILASIEKFSEIIMLLKSNPSTLDNLQNKPTKVFWCHPPLPRVQPQITPLNHSIWGN